MTKIAKGNKRLKFTTRFNATVRLSDFTCMQEPHPFGVLPSGNRFFKSTSSTSDPSGFVGRLEEAFDDNLWQHILGFCDGSSLARVVQVCRHLYIAGHQPELWRDLVLRKCHVNGNVISRVGRSWRDTYVLLFHDDKEFVELRPISMRNVFSDRIFQSHFCRSFTIPSAWLNPINHCEERSSNEVPCVPAEKMSANDFFTQYEEPNQPVVVKGAANGKAVARWSDWEHLHRHSSTSMVFRTTSGAAPLAGNFTLRAYQDYVKFDYLEESPMYLFDRNAFKSNPQWEEDFFPEFYRKCPYWDPSKGYGHDLLQHLGARERPDHTWMIAGPKRSGSVFHIDPNCTHAWNACIQGRKRWIFYPPGEPPPGVLPSVDGDEVALPLSIGEWITQYWPEHVDQYRKRPIGSRPLECTTFPGDVVFVPHGWWHSVINLDEFNIAITHNYLSPSNLGNALKFFVEKQDHISGCRDRAESVKPEHIYKTFVTKLREKEPQHLEKALAQKVWTCHAWTSQIIESNGENEASPGSSNETFKARRTSSWESPENLKTSIMEKTERLESFSFSFL